MNTTMNLPTRKKPEVLSPAGNLRGLKTAVDYGADAVYCGGKAFGMRSAPLALRISRKDRATPMNAALACT